MERCRKYISAGILTLILIPSVSAEVFRTTDAEGNVIFTDKKPNTGESETVKVQPVLTVPATKVSPRSSSYPKQQPAKTYTSLEILSPEDKQSFRNPDSVTVSAKSTPRARAGHSYRLIMDGKSLQDSNTPTFTIQQPDRGAHLIQVQVIDDFGEVVANSPSRTFFVHRFSALLNPQNPINHN